MWSMNHWGESAKASLTQALEKTGDAITKAATQAARPAPAPTLPEQATRDSADDAAAAAAAAKNNKNKSSTNSAQASTSTADNDNDRKATAEMSSTADQPKRAEMALLGNFVQAGWSTVVQTTKASITKAQEAVEEQQSRLQERINEARAVCYKRDPKLPLDVLALKDAQVVYLTDRLISMSHPAMASATNGEITGERKLAAVGHLLQRRHQGRFMVWNISEVDYETRILDEQVLTFSFPGSPSPPLGLLLKLLVSMEAWLKADDRNVAVVHCLTGKGRTSTVLAAFLSWMGQAQFGDIYTALEYIAACKQLTTEQLTIPSQRRYASYFKNMLDGVRPSQPPLMLKRMILSQAPRYAKGPPRRGENTKNGSANNNKDGNNKNDDGNSKNDDDDDDDAQLWGCAPYLQIFKAGELLHTAPASLHFQQASNELPFCQIADGAISFHINQVVQGDILIRCRHLTAPPKKQRVSMFRAAIHTGYVPPKVLRLKKSELDGACNDDRFPNDFFVDLIFESVDAEEASKLLAAATSTSSDADAGAAAARAGESTEAQALAGGATTVTASTYDSMLHRDSRFWDVIAARRQQHAAAADGTGDKDDDDDADDDKSSTKKKQIMDPMWGPTIGRRRDFGNPTKSSSKDSAAAATKAASQEKRTALETFSIGGELDFLPTEEDDEAARPDSPKQAPKKDSLMEALMGALSEEHDTSQKTDENDVEVVVFEDANSAVISEAGSSVTGSAAASGATSKEASVSGDEVSDTLNPATAPTAHDVDDDVAALLAEANLDLDEDMDNLLREAGGTEGLDDLNLDDDDDDDDLEDFENFLSK